MATSDPGSDQLGDPGQDEAEDHGNSADSETLHVLQCLGELDPEGFKEHEQMDTSASGSTSQKEGKTAAALSDETEENNKEHLRYLNKPERPILPSFSRYTQAKLNSGGRSVITNKIKLINSYDRSRNWRCRTDTVKMDLNLLKQISHLNRDEVLTQVSSNMTELKHYWHRCNDPNKFAILIKILAKVSESYFEETKAGVLNNICSQEFLSSLQEYVITLADIVKADNDIFWSNPDEFCKNLFIFFEAMIRLTPATILAHCSGFIKLTIDSSLNALKDEDEFTLNDFNVKRLAKLKKQFEQLEVKTEEMKKKMYPKILMISHVHEEIAPNDFRELSVLPSTDDLLGEMPYVRPNIVNGGYVNVDHYLDVQFRLLREDCYGPLREGIRQYMADPKKNKYDNIKVHEKVTVLKPYHSYNKIGVLLQLHSKKNINIDWANTRRFMYGSLVILTKDNFRTFLLATVIDNTAGTLSKGMVPVSMNDMNGHTEMSLIGQSFTMVESEIYFEPYYHVLKALQDREFEENMAMKDYIVQVQPATNPPNYFKEPAYIRYSSILNSERWPNPHVLGLDQSQYEAYKLALTHEFAVIQGPPGTGKTYLALRVTKTLLRSLQCSILVICYTNHALDQFLEAILEMTQSLVRIGGQCKSEALMKYNLNQLRQETVDEFGNIVLDDSDEELLPYTGRTLEKTGRRVLRHDNPHFQVIRHNLMHSTNHIKSLHKDLEVLDKGIVGYASLAASIKDVNDILNSNIPFRKDSKLMENEDVILKWLFQDVHTNRKYVQSNRWQKQETTRPNQSSGQRYTEDSRHEVLLDNIFTKDKASSNLRNVFNVSDIYNKIMRAKFALKHSKLTEEQVISNQEYIQLWQPRLNCYEMNKWNLDWTSKINRTLHPTELPTEDRWALYYTWIRQMKNIITMQISKEQVEHKELSVKHDEMRIIVDKQILKNKRVIGMTTTGAARLQKLIRSLAPKIVIVEEAAEVLESHIVVSLTRHCQHLILIGDHQQLRPSASHYKLAKHYNMEISLFERMISNGIHSRRLGVQHRMRPSIASLIVPAIYPELENHASVENYPDVRGITCNLFFLTHNNYEDAEDESSSRQNKFEGDMILALANYIMQQGYKAEDVTILAAYSGQMFYMRKQLAQYSTLSEVKITVVDNYQGEESKIILLSLVRNNAKGNIGFLGTANRICVALSRAKEGLYIMGNIEMLKNATSLWKTISKSLEKEQALGDSLTLSCENHPDQITEVQKPEDFLKVPEGGCRIKCLELLSCGHMCPLVCHGYDKKHKDIQCPLECERVLCDLGHVCPLPCACECGPCMIQVRKTLPCGHNLEVYCSVDVGDVDCLTLVEVALPACGHKTMKDCYVDIAYVRCVESCIYRLPCGHACVDNCHKTRDPEHNAYLCEKTCSKLKKGCSTADELELDLTEHGCKKKCYEECEPCEVEVMKKHSACAHRERVKCCVDVNSLPCRQKCKRALPCGHHCANKCHEPCGNCMQMTKKVLPTCGHELEVRCKDEPKAEYCWSKCKRTLKCGHKCTMLCNEPCEKSQCMELAVEPIKSPCGHDVHVLCSDYNEGVASDDVLLKHCSAACDKTLSCGHACSGTCGACRQGRLHAPCNQPCRRSLLCGHECEEPCNEVCPPCNKPCEVRCAHTRCNQLCGQPCSPCKEKCKRACRHGRCTRWCGDPCSRAACDKACPLKRPCGHRCRGLCGEPCPDICNVCDPDNFPKDLLGDAFDDDAKFIQLQDCKAKKGHFMEVEDMDNLMKGDKETIMIRSCPYCRALIINTQRYKDLVNATFQNEINPIKMKVHGTEKNIKQRKAQLCYRAKKISETYMRTCKGKILYKFLPNIKNCIKVLGKQLQLE